MEREKQLGAWSAQACGFAVSASLSKDADAGMDHQQQAAQQEPPGLSVRIECYQSNTWLWRRKKQGPFVREIIVSFKRSPPEDLDGSCPVRSTCRQAPPWKATQQDGPEGREVQQPEIQGQSFSLRCCGGLHDTPGQVSAKDRMGWPEDGTRQGHKPLLGGWLPLTTGDRGVHEGYLE